MRSILSQVLERQDVREIGLNSSGRPGFGIGMIVAFFQLDGRLPVL